MDVKKNTANIRVPSVMNSDITLRYVARRTLLFRLDWIFEWQNEMSYVCDVTDDDRNFT